MQILKRGLALILVLCLCVSTMGLTAFADDGEGDAEPAAATTKTESVVRPDDVTEVGSQRMIDASQQTVAAPQPVTVVDGSSASPGEGLIYNLNAYAQDDLSTLTDEMASSPETKVTVEGEKTWGKTEIENGGYYAEEITSGTGRIGDTAYDSATYAYSDSHTSTKEGAGHDYTNSTTDEQSVAFSFTNGDDDNAAVKASISESVEVTSKTLINTPSQTEWEETTVTSVTFTGSVDQHSEADGKTTDLDIVDTWNASASERWVMGEMHEDPELPIVVEKKEAAPSAVKKVTDAAAEEKEKDYAEREAWPEEEVAVTAVPALTAVPVADPFFFPMIPETYERDYNYSLEETTESGTKTTTENSWTYVHLDINSDIMEFIDWNDDMSEKVSDSAKEEKAAAEEEVAEEAVAAEEEAFAEAKKAVREEAVAVKEEEAAEKVEETFPPAPPAEESGESQTAAGGSLESRTVINYKWTEGSQTITFDSAEQTLDGIGTVFDVRQIEGEEASIAITGTISENADETKTSKTDFKYQSRIEVEEIGGHPWIERPDAGEYTDDIDYFNDGNLRLYVSSNPDQDSTTTVSGLLNLTEEQKAQLDQLAEQAKAQLNPDERIFLLPDGNGFQVVKVFGNERHKQQVAGTSVVSSTSITITPTQVAEGRQEVANKDQLVADIFGDLDNAYVVNDCFEDMALTEFAPSSFSASWEAPVIPLPDGVASMDELELGKEYPAADGKTVVVTQDTDEYGMPKYVVTTRLDGGDGSFDEVVEEYTGDYYISATRSVTAKTETQYESIADSTREVLGGVVASNTEVSLTLGKWQDSEGNSLDAYVGEKNPSIVVIQDFFATLGENCLSEDGSIDLNNLSLYLGGAVTTKESMKLHVYDDTNGEQVYDLVQDGFGWNFKIAGDSSSLTVQNGATIKMMIEAAKDIDDPGTPGKPVKKAMALKAGASDASAPSYWQTLKLSVTQGELEVNQYVEGGAGGFMPHPSMNKLHYTEVKEEISSETLEIKMGAAPAGSGKLFAARTAASNPSKTTWSSLTFSSVTPEEPPTPPTPPVDPPTPPVDPPTPPVDPPTPPVDPPEDPELEEGEEIIEDEEVPLAAPPQTGDSRITYVWVLMMGAAALYLFFDQSSKRRSES